MDAVRRLAMIGGLACGLLAGVNLQAQAQANGVAAVTIRNKTDDTVRYLFKWGKGGQETPITLGSGKGWYHYYPLDDDGLAPRPYIGFDIGGGVYWQEYALEFFVNNGSRLGKPYHFSTERGFIDLFKD
jgi:hypothetical protein